MTRVRTGIGGSELDDAAQAGRLAASAALGQLGDVPPGLVLVYASVRYDLPELLAGVRAVTGDVPLVGASSSGHFCNGAVTPPDRGVAVLALSSGPYRFGIGSATGLRGDPFGTGRHLAEAAHRAPGCERSPYGALIVLSCGLTGDQQQLLDGVASVTGASTPVVGGTASDDRRMVETYVFHDDRVLADAAVGIWVASPHPLTVVHGHGWHPLGGPMPVTGSDGSVVHTIAGRPATEVLDERRPDVPAEAGRCLGLVEPDGSRMLRGVLPDAEGALRTWVPLPPRADVQVMACTQDDLLHVADQIGAVARADEDASVLLAFSCVSRLWALNDRVGEEATRLQSAAGRVPTFGFYTYGEFARTTITDGVHNAAITAVAL